MAMPGGAVAEPGSSATAIGPKGYYYWPVNRVRALDTRVSGALAAGATTRVRVTGLSGVPATGVVSVSVNLTVLTPAVTGSLTAFADGTSWSGATMSFQAGQTNQNFETVPVTGRGMIDIRNNTTRPLTLIVDILGYSQSSQLEAWNQYQSMTPTRLLDTRTGQPLAAGQTRTIQLSGRAGIPLPQDYDDVAVVVNLTVLAPSRSGSLTVGTKNTPSISFAAGRTEQSQLLKVLDRSGGLSIRNNSAAPIQVIADVVGYHSRINFVDAGFFEYFNMFDEPYRIYDSRARGNASVLPGHTVVLDTYPFVNGNAQAGFCAGLLNVTVLAPSTAGSVSVSPYGASDVTPNISFAAHQTRQRQLMMQGGVLNNFQIRNNSSAPITLIADVDGWRTCA
ncbi:MAG TPA: hypothetical protein VFU36_11480 [Jatrophihabitans sp.]|nr:hypothetical protein [Jatrophihabitans sp.]